MTTQVQQRLVVLNALERAEVTMSQATGVLGLSDRQVRRLRSAYRARGVTALVHGNRGHPSPRRLVDALRRRIVRLATTRYKNVNYMHLQELLSDRERLTVSYTSLRRIVHEAGVPSPRTRRPPHHRPRRERMPQAGMLVQFDGSHHAWLEERGPTLVLHAAIDDATGKVLAARFDAQETAAAYLHLFRQIALGPGIPLAAYTDRHGIFTRRPRGPWTLEEQLRGQPAPTQVGRVFGELGMRWIPAGSPQAKGRIERLFGALQDRLVTELRLARIRDLGAANAFLPGFLARYNARFAKPPQHPRPAYRPWPPQVDPQTIFCFKYLRRVANDHTVSLGAHFLQLSPNGRSYAKAVVEVHERLDGSLAVVYQGHVLPSRLLRTPASGSSIRARKYQRLPLHGTPRRKRARRQKTISALRAAGGALTTPAADHPWRQYEQAKRLKALRQMQRTKSLTN